MESENFDFIPKSILDNNKINYNIGGEFLTDIIIQENNFIDKILNKKIKYNDNTYFIDRDYDTFIKILDIVKNKTEVDDINIVQDMKYYKLINTYDFKEIRYIIKKKVSFCDTVKFIKFKYDDKILETTNETLSQCNLSEENYKNINYDTMKIILQFLRTKEIYNPNSELLILFNKLNIEFKADRKITYEINHISKYDYKEVNKLDYYFNYQECLSEKKFGTNIYFKLSLNENITSYIKQLWIIIDYDSNLLLKHPYDIFNYISIIKLYNGQNKISSEIITTLYNDLLYRLNDNVKIKNNNIKSIIIPINLGSIYLNDKSQVLCINMPEYKESLYDIKLLAQCVNYKKEQKINKITTLKILIEKNLEIDFSKYKIKRIIFEVYKDHWTHSLDNYYFELYKNDILIAKYDCFLFRSLIGEINTLKITNEKIKFYFDDILPNSYLVIHMFN